MKKLLTSVSILGITLVSCSQTPQSQYLNGATTQQVTIPTKNCNGYSSEMKVLYGYNSENSGTTFARIIAVDHQDGTMSIAILPPTGQTEFPFPTTMLDKSLRLIACPENGLSVLNPSSALGACKSAPINILGGADKLNAVSNFSSYGVVINGTRVHATRNPATDEGKLLPNFLMLVTTKNNDKDTSNIDLILASGELPYKACYSSN